MNLFTSFPKFCFDYSTKYFRLPWEAWVRYLGWEDPLEEDMATHSSILAWRIPMDKEAWQAMVRGVSKSQTWLSD